MNLAKTKTTDRILSIDFLRFFAIFLVTGFHLGRFIGFYNFSGISYLFKDAFTVGSLGCEIFFVVSAYCMCISYNKKSSKFDFWKAKFINIYPTYIFALIFWIVLVKNGVTSKSADFFDIATHALLIHNLFPSTFYSISGVFWFLGALFNFYLIFPFVYSFISKKPLFSLLLSVILHFAILFCAEVTNLKSPVLLKSIFIYMPCFVCGILAYEGRLRFKNSLHNIVLLSLGLFLLFVVSPSDLRAYFPISLGSTYGVTVGVLCSLGFINNNSILNKLPDVGIRCISVIAQTSFSIYLYNYIFYIAKPAVQNGLALWIYMLVVFSFGIFMYNIVEKKNKSFFGGRKNEC